MTYKMDYSTNRAARRQLVDIAQELVTEAPEEQHASVAAYFVAAVELHTRINRGPEEAERLLHAVRKAIDERLKTGSW